MRRKERGEGEVFVSGLARLMRTKGISEAADGSNYREPTN